MVVVGLLMQMHLSSHTGIRQCRTYLRNIALPSLVKSLHRDEDPTWLLLDICAQRRNSIGEDRINGISPTEID
jgi:hypothetical protein